MREELNSPLYILKGENRFRYLSILLLSGIILFGVYAIQFVGLIMLFVILAAVFGLITIRFPFLYLYKDSFLIEKKCLLKNFSDREIFKYREISEIEFIKGYIKWSQLILQTVFGKGAYGGFSKPDQMILKFQDNTEKIIYRFGKRNEFENVIKIIQKKIKPSS